MKKNIFICFIFATAAFLGCSSKEQDDTQLSTSILLTQSEWTSVTNLEDIDRDGVFVEFGDDCEKDDHWIFRTDNTFIQTHGAVVCDAGTTPNSTFAEGEWHLENNDKQLVLVFFADDIRLVILSINDSELQMGLIEANNPEGVITQKVILKR